NVADSNTSSQAPSCIDWRGLHDCEEESNWAKADGECLERLSNKSLLVEYLDYDALKNDAIFRTARERKNRAALALTIRYPSGSEEALQRNEPIHVWKALHSDRDETLLEFLGVYERIIVGRLRMIDQAILAEQDKLTNVVNDQPAPTSPPQAGSSQI